MAAVLAGMATAVVLLAMEEGRLRRQLQEARRLDLSPVPLDIDPSPVVPLPTGGGNAALHYQRALELLEDEEGCFQQVLRELTSRGVTPTLQLNLRALGEVLAGTDCAYCRFPGHPPRTKGELDFERARLGRLVGLGRVLAAASRQAQLAGESRRARDLAGRLAIFGWHLMRATVGPARTGAGEVPPATVSLDARIAGLTLIRWGAHALADVLQREGGTAEAQRARDLERRAARLSDVLADRRRLLRRNPFLQARVAEEGTDPGQRLFAVILLGEGLSRRRPPLIVGRAQYNALMGMLRGLADDPNPDIAAAAKAALEAIARR